ncbi:MAG: tetratricopeptide repeat protein [Planctomycetota bacterium]|nr:tetratricopeptide repeat protein [Planctomycetota bacterium]
MSWSTLWGWYPYMPYRVLILISLGMFAFNRRKIDVTALLLWTLFFVFSLMALRNMVFFALAAYLSFLANGQYLDDEEFLPPRWRGKRVRAVFSTALKVGLIIWIIGHGRDLMLRGYYDFDKFERKSEFGGLSQRNFPHQAADFLVDNKVRGNFFNDFNSGAYLIGRTFPEVKVYIDGRTEVYGADFFKEHREIWQGDAALFDEAADRYRLTGAFLNSVYVPAPEKLIRHLYTSKAWILVYFDYDAAVFLRDLPGNRDMINRYAIDLSQWQVPEAPLLKIGTHKVIPYRYVNRAYALYNMGFPGKAEGEAVEALRIEPYNAKAHKLLGKIYNERGAYARAFESLRKAKLLLPRDSKVRYQIALALFHMGEIKQAEEQCQRVLSLKPEDEEALVLMNRIRAAGESNKEMEAVPAL